MSCFLRCRQPDYLGSLALLGFDLGVAVALVVAGAVDMTAVVVVAGAAVADTDTHLLAMVAG